MGGGGSRLSRGPQRNWHMDESFLQQLRAHETENSMGSSNPHIMSQVVKTNVIIWLRTEDVREE